MSTNQRSGLEELCTELNHNLMQLRKAQRNIVFHKFLTENAQKAERLLLRNSHQRWLKPNQTNKRKKTPHHKQTNPPPAHTPHTILECSLQVRSFYLLSCFCLGSTAGRSIIIREANTTFPTCTFLFSTLSGSRTACSGNIFYIFSKFPLPPHAHLKVSPCRIFFI